MSNVEFTVASDRDSWIVVGPLSSGSTRVVARCDEQRDAETLSLLLNVPFDDLIGVVRAVVELAADDDLSLVQIRSRVAGMGASAASWLARVGSITATAGGDDGSTEPPPGPATA